MATTALPALDEEAEEFVARLTRTAYEVVLARGLPAAFVDVELDLWRRLRDLVRTRTTAREGAPHLFTTAETGMSGIGQAVPKNAAPGSGIQDFFV